MTTVKKKPKLTLPPAPQQVNEKAMKAMIEKGGAVAETPKASTAQEEDVLRSFTIKIYESELVSLRAIRERSGKRKKPSIQDLIIEGVHARIKKG